MVNTEPMKAMTAKTARFAIVVKECGKPQPVFLWTKPEKNRDLQSAIRHNRVMTVKQEAKGTRKDFGIVGFVQEKNASYLVFPRPLSRFKERRIVGINYDLIKEPGPIGRLVKPDHLPKHKRQFRRTLMDATIGKERGRTQNRRPQSQSEKWFQVTIRFTSTSEVTNAVEASSVSAARDRALNEFQPPDLSRGTVTKKVLRADRIRA